MTLGEAKEEQENRLSTASWLPTGRGLCWKTFVPFVQSRVRRRTEVIGEVQGPRPGVCLQTTFIVERRVVTGETPKVSGGTEYIQTP